MTVRFGVTNVNFEVKKLWIIGLTCPLFLLCCIHPNQFWKIMFAFQAFVCFWSDYMTSGEYSISHGIDRWFAKLNFIYVAFYLGFLNMPLLKFFMLVVPPFISFVLSMHAIKTKNGAAYLFWHSMW